MVKYLCKIVFRNEPEPASGWRTYVVSARHPEEAMEKAMDLFVVEAPSAFGGWHVQVCAANPESKTLMHTHKLKVTIDDDFCAHEFPLTNVPGSVSINSAAEALAKSIKATLGESKRVRGYTPPEHVKPTPGAEESFNFKVTIDDTYHAYEYPLVLDNSYSIHKVAEALGKAIGIKASLEGKMVRKNIAAKSPGTVDTLFRSGDDKQDATALLDCAYDIMEIWKAEGPYNQSLRKAWMKRAREFGAVPSP